MELVIKRFEELSNKELYNILKLRSEVFVVEQKCNYVDMDDIDYDALHIYFKEDNFLKTESARHSSGEVHSFW